MSTAINQAVWGRLAGIEDLSAYPDALAAQTALAGLLGTDDSDEVDGPRPAVFFGNMAQTVADFAGIQKPVPFDCITFRADGGLPDPRFKVQMGHVGDLTYSFEIWTKQRSATRHGDIAEQMEIMLDRPRGAPPLPVGAGILYWSEATMELAGPFVDQAIHAWVALVRYTFKQARY